MSYDAEAWNRVATWISAQLTERGWLQADLVRETGLSPEGVRPVMKGVAGNYRAGTLSKIALALGATGDSIQRILDGLEPIEVRPAAEDRRISALEARMDRVQEQLDELLRRLPGPTDR